MIIYKNWLETIRTSGIYSAEQVLVNAHQNLCFSDREFKRALKSTLSVEQASVLIFLNVLHAIVIEIFAGNSTIVFQIKLPTLNDNLSALRCVQIVGGSKSLFCGKLHFCLYLHIFYMLIDRIKLHNW